MAQGDTLGIIKNRPSNILINGDFALDQRNAGALDTVHDYAMDRWFFAGGTSIQRVAVTNEIFEYVAQVLSTATSNSLLQRIKAKNVAHLRGKEVTFSIKIKLVSGAWSGLVPQLRVHYANTKDNFAGTTAAHADADLTPLDEGSTFPTGAFRIFKKTFIVTDEMADNGFFIQPGDFAGQTLGVVQYAHAMLNEGAVVAQFELAGVIPSLELALAQEYYEKSYNIDVAPGTVTNAGMATLAVPAGGTGYVMGDIRFAVAKRVEPSVTLYDTSGNIGKVEYFSSSGGSIIDNQTGGVDRVGTSAFRVFTDNVTNKFGRGCHYTANAEL